MGAVHCYKCLEVQLPPHHHSLFYRSANWTTGGSE